MSDHRLKHKGIRNLEHLVSGLDCSRKDSVKIVNLVHTDIKVNSEVKGLIIL